MEKNRNDILLALIRIARDAGVEWEDTLPITAQPPFRYTTDTPFQYPTTDEEGSPTTSPHPPGAAGGKDEVDR